MPDLKKYWQEIRAIERVLDGDVWLMSAENRSKGQVAGRMVQAAASIAAKLLHDKSHRLASDEETQAYLVSQVQTRQQVARERLRERGIAVIPLESHPRSE